MRRTSIFLIVGALASVLPAVATGAAVPRDSSDSPVIQRMAVEPNIGHVGSVLTMRGTGCVDPETGSATGMAVRWVPTLTVEDGNWPDIVPSRAQRVPLAEDGSFTLTARVEQPPALVREIIAWCVRDATNEPFGLYQPDPALHLVAPEFLLEPVAFDGSFAFVSPCSVPRGGKVELLFTAGWFLPWYGQLHIPGPVRAGQRVARRVPSELRPGDWRAYMTCSPSEGALGSVYERGFHVSRGFGSGPPPPPAIRRVRSRADVLPGGGWSLVGQQLNAEVVAISDPTPGFRYGYYLAAADGGVFTYGGAPFHGSAAALPLVAPIVDIAIDPLGRGYWLVGADGGVFAFGAPFHGSAAPLRLRHPIVAIIPTRTGGGYWLVGADGGVHAFGDAPFHGSAARPRRPIVDGARSGDGYLLLGSDGGVFTFGATFHGSAVGQFGRNDPAVAIVANDTGYRVVSAGGDHIPFGRAPGGPEFDRYVPRWVIDAADSLTNDVNGTSQALVVK